ncbi:uncharacterized protein DNG_01819 [Cephalotrichum gorgonifer]|uniref:Uncharacterized protein n=1 Tax=Cephalotrichum gorgonifer TaxID=2041049 RepID=A0AAE8MTT8_9PEZI|nr:uncharacterized protein DNG_01819 [Cephalotrichum gorgonifer]
MQTPPSDDGTRTPSIPARSPRGLGSSRWASAKAPTPAYHANKYPSTTINPAVPVAPAPPSADAPNGIRHSYELQRFEKIAKRLSWKLFHLSAGFHRATAEPEDDPSQRAHFEIMFKLDFYEFYMLLERALVHLLGVFDISVARDASSANGFIGPGRRGDHAYHHNVLAAFDSPDNVLHGVLGTGDVRWCLSKAKEMRNKWKYLDEQAAAGAQGTSELGLEECNVESILETIVNAFEVAYEVAKGKVMSETCEEPQPQEDWGFMVDAMDWEAV